MKRRTTTIIISVILFLFALGLTLYPVVANYVNQKYASEVHTAYLEVVEQADDTALQEAKEMAVCYNQAIIPGAAATDAYSKEAILSASEDYDHQLNVTGDGIMGYIEIPIPS